MKTAQIMQFSFVVESLDLAIEHWATKFHVGPFFVVDHVPYSECFYRGEPTDIDMSVAIAYHGSMQIELVKQHNEAPSIFTDFANKHCTGMQHVAQVSDNLEADLALYSERGLKPIQYGKAENGTAFAYLDSDINPVPGTMLELVQLPEQIVSAFAYMQKTSESWDPLTDPARR